MKDKVFFIICFGFILGVLLRSFIFVNFFSVVLLWLISFAIILFFIFLSSNRSGIIIGILVLAFSFGVFRFNLTNVSVPKNFESYLGKKEAFLGVIVDEPEIKENNQKLTIRIFTKEEKTKVLAAANLDKNFKYGDQIEIEGILEKPENFITDQGKNFDYVNYLRRDKIFYVMKYPKIEVISSGHGNFIKSILFSIKGEFLDKLNLVIKEPESLLMGGLILGEKSSFDESLRQSFINTGTIHIVALSGYNVTIVAEWIMKLFSFLPLSTGIGIGIFSIFLFVLMSGSSSTAIRAGVMASLALSARLIGRNYDVGRALIITGVVMILINPFILVFDVSFQLSFIATVAVIFFAARIEKYFLWVTDRFGLRDIVSVTFAAYIFVLPFILYKMGNLSLVSLPANVLILPFIPLTMVFGFLTGVVGTISYLFSIPFGFISQFLLHYELMIIKFFSDIPFASITVPDFPFLLTILIYIYFIYKLFWKSIKSFFLEG